MSIESNTGAAATGGAWANPFALARRAFRAWRSRARDLRALAALDERTLKDLGLSRYDVWAEAAKWRWRRA
jgi:uncharacterized protein YjiS (DUF1127 family)